MRTKQEFIEENKDIIICEPSGRTLEELENDKITKMMIIGELKR